jgi:hypothetical protein
MLHNSKEMSFRGFEAMIRSGEAGASGPVRP